VTGLAALRPSKPKTSTIAVQGSDIAIVSKEHGDYISLTDMARKFGDESLIYNWMRNRNTLELIGIWEKIHNPAFKGIEFETFKTHAGLGLGISFPPLAPLLDSPSRNPVRTVVNHASRW
jgi:hypothetical protein